jgi:hypothetical protein
MNVQDNNYKKKYLKYKKKYLLEGAGILSNLNLSSISLPSLPNTSFTPEQLVIKNRQKYEDSKLALNKANNNLEDAKLKENFANKAYNKDKNSVNLTKLNNAENIRKVAETSVISAQKNIELAKNEYKKSKETARKLKLDNAKKAVENRKNELKLAQDELARFKKQEEARLAKKANKSKSLLLIKDGSPTESEESETISLPKIESKNIDPKNKVWKCQENITLDDGYVCAPDGSWECPNYVKHQDGFSCNGVRYTPDKKDLSAYDYLSKK